MLSGDIGGPTFGLYVYGVHPWEDWDLFRRHSPLTYATEVTTPLLIQHAEKDLRCTVTQAEELFAVLRSLRKTVRLMRVPTSPTSYPLGNAVPAGRQPAADRRVVPPLPRRGQDAGAERRPEPGLSALIVQAAATTLGGDVARSRSGACRGLRLRCAWRDLRRRHARRGGAASVPVRVPLAMMNRHGLVAGATGTGKTKTLQVLAEQLSDAGVPVFISDIKGDISGLAAPAEPNEKLTARAQAIGLRRLRPEAFPVEFLTLDRDGKGVRLRASVSSFGPILLAKVLDLNETQQSVLALAFKYATTSSCRWSTSRIFGRS